MAKYKFEWICVITDCIDSNTVARQAIRYKDLFGVYAHVLRIDQSDLEVSGNITDVLDSVVDGSKGLIVANVAPRDKSQKKWANGIPFCYFEYNGHLIISTIGGYGLSLMRKLDLVESVKVMDFNKLLDHEEFVLGMEKSTIGRLKRTQFRSFEVVPRVAKLISTGADIDTEDLKIEELEDIGTKIWWIDNFGNCKTAALPEEIGFEDGKSIDTPYGKIKCFEFLKDVPVGETALTIGSSGIGDKRFVEFVVQGQSAAKKYNLNVGVDLFNFN